MEATETTDYFQSESMLTAAERLFRDKIRGFVDQECMSVIADHFDKGTFPLKLIPRMADMGLFWSPCGWLWLQEREPHSLWLDMPGTGAV